MQLRVLESRSSPAWRIDRSLATLHSERAFWIVATLSTAATIGILAVPTRHVGPAILLLATAQAIALVLGCRRSPDRHRFTWGAYFLGILLLGPTGYGVSRVETATALAYWRPLTVAVTMGSLGCFAAGASCFRVFLSVPSTARATKVGLAGFTLVSVGTQWMALGEQPRGMLLVVTSVGCAVGSMALIAVFCFLARELTLLGRRSDLALIGAGAIFGLGAAANLLHSVQPISVAPLFAPTLLATGLIAAVASRRDMDRVGRPLRQLTERQPTMVSVIVLLVALAADGAVVGLIRSNRALTMTGAVIAAALATQVVIIAWLAGLVWSRAHFRHVGEGHRLRRELRLAVARDELVAHFQPILRGYDLVVAGYETLARWNHPRLGPISAQRFIPMAETEGFLASIDHLMIRRAAESLSALLDSAGVDEPFVTVNVDPCQMQAAGFAQGVLDDLIVRGLCPEGLVIELTETAAITDWDGLRTNVELFQAAGIGFAIDDFGSGHANFSLLIDLDPDLVKLDQGLITLAMTSARGTSVVRNALLAARSSGARVVAEGVSDESWIPRLQDMGFDFLQGYVLGMASPVSECIAAGDLSGSDPSLAVPLRLQPSSPAMGRRQSTRSSRGNDQRHDLERISARGEGTRHRRGVPKRHPRRAR
jgi:EAL domain-containing protein (putative c-di-GMP-specific phosphodiesterase class I)